MRITVRNPVAGLLPPCDAAKLDEWAEKINAISDAEFLDGYVAPISSLLHITIEPKER
jgi:hypothetical protein